MFARFRDENAIMDPGLIVSGASHLSEGKTFTGEDSCQTLTLSCGRRLAWSEFGHRHGYPILYMHRQGGSRLEALLLHDAAREAGFRLIAVDRPGLGGSDFIAFNDPALLADDYVQLLDHLRLLQLAVFSWGGGSRFALAFAARFPQRVSFLNLLSPRERSCSLTNNRLFGFCFRITLRLLLSARTLRPAKNDARYLQRWRDQMCYADKKQMDDPTVGTLLAKIAHESTRQGSAGVAQDIWFGLSAANMANSDFAESGMGMPVHVWNGSEDVINRPYLDDTCGVRDGIIRHWVRRQGHLFFRQAAGDIFRVARRAAGVNPGAGDPLHR